MFHLASRFSTCLQDPPSLVLREPLWCRRSASASAWPRCCILGKDGQLGGAWFLLCSVFLQGLNHHLFSSVQILLPPHYGNLSLWKQFRIYFHSGYLSLTSQRGLLWNRFRPRRIVGTMELSFSDLQQLSLSTATLVPFHGQNAVFP